MANAKAIMGLGAIALLLAGAGGDDIGPPEPDPDPNDPNDPNKPGPPKPPPKPADGPKIAPPPPGVSPSDVLSELLSDEPEPGRIWMVEPGTNPSQALQTAYGESGAAAFRAITDCQFNWGLYATEGQAGTSWSAEVDGVVGTVTSAWFPMFESVIAAVDVEERLPQRTVLWNRGSNNQVQPRSAGALPYPLAGGHKTWGGLYFPRRAAWNEDRFNLAKNPAPLFAALGIAIAEWNPWEAT